MRIQAVARRLVPLLLVLARQTAQFAGAMVRFGLIPLARWLGRALAQGSRKLAAVLGPRWAATPVSVRAGIGGAAAIIVVVLVVALNGSHLLPAGAGHTPAPTSNSSGSSGAPVASPAPTPGFSVAPAPSLSVQAVTQLLNRLMPTPPVTDTVLLVADPANLTAAEQTWLSDLRANLGNVDPLAYKDASTDRLRKYFVVFVTDASSDLDPSGLAGAFASGVSIHLVGPASTYQAQIQAQASAGSGQ
jgi:hypothetical protein